ncbi:MAG: hypothetical protein WC443_12660 [Desulfobaccales bacterium]
MSAEMNEKAASGLKKTWCTTATFAVNLGRRLKILGRYGLACWQQQKLKCALGKLGDKTFKALEQGEANPLTAPEVNAAVLKAKELKEAKEKNYLAIQAIRERIKGSCVIPTPDEPGGIDENPEVP